MQEDGESKKNPAQALEIVTYQSGEAILKEGSESPFFFVILEGQVRLSRNGKKIRMLTEQDIFGLESLMLDQPSHYSAHALKNCRISKYGSEALDHMISENPRMVRNLLTSVLHQLAQTTFNLLDPLGTFLVDDTRVSFYGDGEVILDPDSPRTDFFRLVSTHGGLRVTVGEREITRIHKPGEIFGLFNFPAQVIVRSIGESAVEVYKADDLDLIIRDYPEVARQMMRSLMDRFSERDSAPTVTGTAAVPQPGD
ncbi:MAG: cyclic nucleotide-binding domain-containing protein [Syntrophobacteraceae bacterium]